MKFGKLTKKAISVILAVMLIMSCVTISLTAFASVSPFGVPKESPAVPLFKGKAIELKNLSVEIGGTFQSGETLTWTKKSGSSAKKSGTQIVASAVGNTRFEVSDASGNKQNVWVLVNEVGNTDFAIANVDFENSADRGLTSWVGSAASASNAGGIYTSGGYQIWSGGAQPTVEQIETDEGTKWSMKIGGPNSQLGTFGTFLCNTALKDFSDYSVIARMSQKLISAKIPGANATAVSAGMFVRTTLSSSASPSNVTGTNAPKALAEGTKSLHIRFRNFGGIMLCAYDANGNAKTTPSNYLYGDSANMYYTNTNLKDDLWVSGDDSKVFTPEKQDGISHIRDVRVDLQGTGIRYSLDNNVIFDTIADNDVYGMFTPVNDSKVTENSNGPASTFKTNEFPAEYTEVGPISHEEYVEAYNTNLQAQKGTIGFSNGYGTFINVYSVKVIPSNFDENSLPVYVGEAEPTSNDIPVNTRYNLANEGQDIIWSNIRTNEYEVNNGILSVFAKPAKNKIVVYGMNGELSISKTFDVLDKGAETKLAVTKFADDNMTIVPITNQDNTYKVCIDTANGNEVKHGTITLKDGEETVKVYNGILGSNKGNEFEFTAYNPSGMLLSAEYTTRAGNVASIYDLGRTIRLESNQKGAGIRFLTRIPAISKDATGEIVVADTINVSDNDVTIDEIGTLMLPTELLGGKELKFPENYTSGDVYVNGNKVRKSVISNLAKVTDKYADAYTTIGNMNNGGFGFDPLSVDISTVSYIKYHDAGGKTGFVYSADKKNGSYNAIEESAFPLEEADKTVDVAIAGGTNHSLDMNDATNDVSYAVGEDVIFSYRLSGAYTADWKLCKDEPSRNAVGNEVFTKNAENIVASGKTQQGENVLTVSTKMNRPGTVKLVITVTDSYGQPVKFANGDATVTAVVAVGAQDIKQSMEVADILPANSAVALNNMYKTFNSRAIVIKTAIENNKADIASFLTTASAGQSKNIDNKLAITCAKVENGYRYFDFAIAVNDAAGIKTTQANGLFADGAYNKRPATGSLVVPVATASLTSLVANYQDGSDAAYGEGIANTVIVNTNMHGYDNAKAVSDAGYIEKLENTSFADGGIQNFLTAETENSITEPTDSYAYGVIYRDYLALQTAKKLFRVIMNKGASNITANGDTLGGWQALLVSAFDTEVTNTNAVAPYFASIGGNNVIDTSAQDIGEAIKYFSSVSAAERIANTMSSRPASYTINISGKLADMVSPANGVIATYAALKNANCNKSITMKQFADHKTAPFETAKLYDSVLSGTYDATEGRAEIDTSYKERESSDPNVAASPTRSEIVVGGDFIYDRSNFKVPANLMTTDQYQAKIESMRTSAESKSDASNAFMNELDNLDIMLQDQIVYNSADLVNNSGYTKKYYVAANGNDSNDGLSPEHPWKTIRKVNITTLPAGSLVSFRRGDTFYGVLQPKSNIDYGAYGTGYKPQLLASYEANSRGWKWVETEVKNIWKLDHKFESDLGSSYGLNFTLDMVDALSIATMIDKDGNQAVVYHKDWLSEVDHNYQYVYVGPNYNKHKSNVDVGFAIECNPGDNCFYMYCDEGNPGELFKEIQIGLNSSVLNENNKYIENIHVNNLELLYGRGPFWPGNCKNIKVSYCTCGWQGGFDDGSQTHGVPTMPTPYGGGGGVYGTCDNFVWDHCYIFQQWDSGLSAQANHNTETDGAVTHYKDFITTNCLFKGTKWTLELWLNINATNKDTIEHMVFDYNIVRDTGYGFNDFQPEESACVEMWGYSNECHNCSIQHNIFDRPYDYIYRNLSGYTQDDSYVTVYTFEGTKYMPVIDYNICIHTKGKHLAKINRMMDKHYPSDVIYYYNDSGIAGLQNFGIDTHGLFLYADR